MGLTMKKNNIAISVALALMGYTAQGLAQTAVDLQGGKPPQPIPSDASVLPKFQASPSAVIQSGGVVVTLMSVELTGNRSISSQTLLAQLGSVSGKQLDMAGLTALANSLANYYRASGYPFAQAYLPPQDLKQGVLRINVLEGAYGSVSTAPKEGVPTGAQSFLDHGLKVGDAIHNQQLERTLLILDDQPGMKIHPVIKPGAKQGEADLIVGVERESYVNGEVGLDNTGPRSTGEYRARGALAINSPFRFGDKISLSGLVTNENMWLGSVDYEAPIGASGLRGQVGYAHTSYVLGGPFANLDASGIADVTTAKLTYPLVRSQATNVLLSAGLQYKKLEDEHRVSNVVRKKTSWGVPVGLQFDRRDAVLGGGVTYGSLTWLYGDLDLDTVAKASDATTAKTNGSFNKINLDVARIQKIKGDMSAYARFSGQWADKNLDSSEKFNLGGYYGVRAYPLGEGVGDKGWFTQIELRYALGSVTPFLFYDYGTSQSNVNPWDVNSGAKRTVAGAGVGIRSIYEKWSIDGSLAWRTEGGESMADSRDRNPRLFVMLGRRF